MPSRPEIGRLLLTVDTVGGVWTYGLELARAWGQRGTQVLLASSGPEPSAAQAEAARALTNVQWVHRVAALEWMEDPWTDVDATGEWLLEWRARFNPDLVHLNEFSHGALPWGVPILVVAHSCVLSWWRAVLGEAAPASYAAYQQHVTLGLRAATMVAAPTCAMLNALQDEYGSLANTCVISNGRTALREPAQTKLPMIISAGRLWDRAKNIELLESIALDLIWPVYVAGPLSPTGQEQKPFEHMEWMGTLTEHEMVELLGRGSIYAAPARYEPFGLGILEAALSRCALVLADIPSLRESWEGAALFVSPDDPKSWLKTLNDLSDDPQARMEWAERAFERARTFSAERMLSGYAHAYSELMADSLRRAA